RPAAPLRSGWPASSATPAGPRRERRRACPRVPPAPRRAWPPPRRWGSRWWGSPPCLPVRGRAARAGWRPAPWSRSWAGRRTGPGRHRSAPPSRRSAPRAAPGNRWYAGSQARPRRPPGRHAPAAGPGRPGRPWTGRPGRPGAPPPGRGRVRAGPRGSRAASAPGSVLSLLRRQGRHKRVVLVDLADLGGSARGRVREVLKELVVGGDVVLPLLRHVVLVEDR